MRLAGRTVAVVGAGIAGLAAATALAQRGAHVRVYEQAPALGEVGAGLQVAPNGVAVLEALGLRDAAERVASLPQGVELVDHRRGKEVARVPLGAVAVARYGRPYWHFHRADLLAVLAGGAAEAGVEIRTGAAVTGTEAGPCGVTIRTAAGEEGHDIAIAADGVRSQLRAAHVDDAPARFAGHVAWRALVPAGAAPDEYLRPVARVTMGHRRHLVTYPLRAGTCVNLVAIEERDGWAEEGWSQDDDPDRMRASFAGWEGAPRRLLGAVESCFVWGLFDHAPLERWTDGRLALIGDACHPMLPFLAQGATMALEDAWVLADCLDLADDPREGLVAYETARMGRATRVQRAAVGAGRVYHLGPGLRGPANVAIAIAAAVAPGRLLGRLDWLYAIDVTRAA